jgi:hypothetical protein
VITLISFVIPPTPASRETAANAASLSDWCLTSPVRVTQSAVTFTSSQSAGTLSSDIRACSGPPALRHALFEAAQTARPTGSPDHNYYVQTSGLIGGNRACLALARKLLKRSYHTLRELKDDALQAA